MSACSTCIAIDTRDQQLTYRDLDEATNELAQRLVALGVGPGDRVGVRVTSGTAQLYIAILGVIRSGAAYVPVDADDPAARAEAVWAAAGVCAVIEDELAITELARGTGAERRLTADDDAWIIFTSGSTGRPKGVAVSHRSAAAFVDAETHLWTVHPEDRVLAGLSVGFDASCEEMWLAWRNGAALVPAPRALVRSGVRARAVAERARRDRGLDCAHAGRHVGRAGSRRRPSAHPRWRGVPGRARLAARRRS